jgi:M6 family metalloprotease-like protein
MVRSQVTSFVFAARRLLLVAGALVFPVSLRAQTDVEWLGRLQGGAKPPPGYYDLLRSNPNAFRFSGRNGWIQRGRRVAELRRRQRGRMMLQPNVGRVVGEGVVQGLAAAQPGGILSGDLNVPVFLVVYENTDSAHIATTVTRSALETRLYGADPAPPYSVHTYYRELSNDQLRVNGTVFDWARVPQADTVYEGAGSGIGADSKVAELIGEIVSVWDATVDFGQFDNDGPDGLPNSGDDDGYVDAVVVMHPEVDGSCVVLNPPSGGNIWAHSYSRSSWLGYGPATTNDASANGGNILVDDYIIQGGQGGDDSCTDDEPQAMGLVAHETGHVLGLPDLYDTIGSGSGIGRWGLMGSGNRQVSTRPAHLTAWSKSQLGWVTEVLVDVDSTLDVSPVVTADTTYVVPVPNTTEYFILENRQRIGSDSMLFEPGLLVWHVDAFLASVRGNNVNGFTPYAMALVQADGRDDLLAGTNRGDSGDPFPGLESNTTLGACTTPSTQTNDGSPSLVSVESITQLEPFGAMRADIRFEVPGPIAIVDSTPEVGFYGATDYQYQFSATGGVECYQDWELIGGALPLGMTLSASGLIWGQLREMGDFTIDVRVTSGTESDSTSLTLNVVAPALALDSVVNHLLEISTPLSDAELQYMDLQGNNNEEFDLGDFVAWMESTAGAVSAAEVAAVLEAARAQSGGGKP